VIAVGAEVPEVDVYDGKGAAPLPVFYQGPTLLLFFRDGCGRCEGMLGLVAGLGRIAKDLTVIGVSQETIEDTAKFLKRIGIKLPVVIDDRPYGASAAFGIETLPAVALLENDAVTWTSDGCSAAEVEELATLMADRIGDREFGLRPEYVDETPIASKHLN